MNVRTLLSAILIAACLAAGGVVASGDVLEAELEIEVPDYVDGDVTVESDGNQTHYTIPHDTARIAPQNFDPDDVVRFGIEEDEATLTYDEDFDYYQLDANGETANFRAYWVVETERVDGNETVTDQQRYEAIIRVEAADEYEHIPAGDFDSTREAANNWDQFASDVEGVVGDGADIETQAELAVRLLELRNNPLAALTGSFTAIAVLMVSSLGGLLMLALLLSYAGYINRDLFRFYNRERSLKADEAGVDDKLHHLEHEERKQALQNMDWQDVVEDDTTARAFRETMGETVYDGTKTLGEVLLPETLVRDRLLAMGESGYVADVQREATDGGDTEDATPAIASVELTTDPSDDADVVQLQESETAFDEVVEAIDLTNDDLQAFDLTTAAAHPGVEMRGVDFEELMEELQVRDLDFESTEAWGKYLSEYVDTVRDHEFTTADGTPRTNRAVLNQFLQTSQLLSDRYQIPMWEFYSDAVEAALVSHSPTRDAQQTVDAVINGEDI